MLDHQLVEAPRISQDTPHHQRIGDRLDPVGEAERAVHGEEAHLGQLASGHSLGRGGVSVQLGEPDLARPPCQKLDDRDIVDRRLGVG